MHHLADGVREIAFRLHGIRCVHEIADKCGEFCFQTVKYLWSEAPEVHGNDGVIGNVDLFAVVFVPCAAFFLVQLGAFLDAHEVSVLVRMAFTARYGAVFGERVAEHVANHAEMCAFGIGVLDEFRSLHVCVASVEVIRIDNSEAVLENILAAEERVCGAPGLGASFGNFAALGNADFHTLERVFHGDSFFNAMTDGFAENLVVLFLDDENNPVKSRLDCVKNGEIDDEFAVFGKLVNLL